MAFNIIQGIINLIGGSGNVAEVDASGSLHVTSKVPLPTGKTKIKEGGFVATVTKQGGTNNYDWVISNGATVTITQFRFGGMITKDGDSPIQAKCELWYRPNGNNTGQELVDSLYLHGMSDIVHFLDEEYTGDGTKELRIKVTNESKENIECIRFIEGWY